MNSIRLRETKRPPAPGARVIDTSYKVVTPPKKHWATRLRTAVLAALVAAVVGLVIPPVLAALIN